MNELLIRNAEPSDYKVIIKVVDEWWGGRRMSDMLPKLFFVHFQSTSFVAEQNGKIVGFVTGFVSQTFLTEAYIHFVGINPNYRKSGIARALYEKFFKAVSSLGIQTVQCVTSPINKVSIAFHRSLGFSIKEGGKLIDGVSTFEGYDGQGEDRVLFYKALNIQGNA
jgi:ribosomal protein S18 acetylase RimI-like enzyme